MGQLKKQFKSDLKSFLKLCRYPTFPTFKAGASLLNPYVCISAKEGRGRDRYVVTYIAVWKYMYTSQLSGGLFGPIL